MTKPEDDDPAFARVRAWPKLRAEPKLAWWFIWRQAGRRPDTVWINYCELAADQGTGERSGRLHIETLANRGLLEIVEKLPQRVRLYVWEPAEVCEDRDRAVEQGRPLLSPLADQAADTTPQPAPADPAQHHVHDPAQPTVPSESRILKHLPTSDPSGPLPVTTKVSTPTAGRPAQHPAQQPPAGPARLCGAVDEALGRLLAGPGDTDRIASAERLAARLRQGVSGLRSAPAVRIARYVVAGEFPETELQNIIGNLKRLKETRALRLPEWCYFTSACAKACRRLNLYWPESSKEPVR